MGQVPLEYLLGLSRCPWPEAARLFQPAEGLVVAGPLAHLGGCSLALASW